jgi:S1-C subfamily serine protease
VGATVTPQIANKMSDLRVRSGVVVLARTADPTEAELLGGDVIHSVNDVPIANIDALRHEMQQFKRGDAVVLQVERQGGLQFVSFELD